VTGKKVWAIGAATFLLGAGAAFAVTAAVDDDLKVTVQPESAAT
jgi:demethoxyubiquinone hydroxylase (CLK1/Coq7/Cat5 family)